MTTASVHVGDRRLTGKNKSPPEFCLPCSTAPSALDGRARNAELGEAMRIGMEDFAADLLSGQQLVPDYMVLSIQPTHWGETRQCRPSRCIDEKLRMD